ncbi:MAG: AAA family ATPase, partial [Caldilineaceae bacterium]|nr:AAA family ATPase [Caldilineaceae bacterium]
AASNGVGVYHIYGDETTQGEGYNMQQVPKEQQGLFGQITALMGQSYVLHTPGALRDCMRRGTACVHHPYKAGPFYLLLPLNTQPEMTSVNLDTLPARTALPAMAAATPVAYAAAVEKIAGARRIVIKAGGGTRGHGDAVRRLAERIGAAVVLSPGSTGAYEDFVVGLFPRPVGSGLAFEVRPGDLLRANVAAERGEHVLVIDEINRADLARVFGEVMQLIEYREQSLALAAGGHLRIPANVRILGTMNTADRSIALVDAALRRRFAFLALYPDFDILRHFHNAHDTGFPVERLVTVLRRLNRDIGDVDYALGVTFFLRADLVQTMPAVWQTEVEPYLEAFFFDRSEMIAPFRWSALADEILGERQGRAT